MWRSKKRRSSNELNAKEISTLVQVANVSESDIRRWHADFLDHYPSGRLNRQTFVECYQKLHPNIGPASAFEKIFDIIDVNHDGTIEYNELLVAMVLMSHANDIGTKIAFAFDMWDESGDGLIDQSELADVISAIYDCAGVTDRSGEQDPKTRAKTIIDQLSQSGNRKLSKQDLIRGCQNDPVIRRLLAPGS